MWYHTDKMFLLKFWQLKSVVTLKIRSRSPKPGRLFILPHSYIHTTLVRIHSLVYKITYSKALLGTKLDSLSPVVILKIRSSSPSSTFVSDITMQFWSESIHRFMRYYADNLFGWSPAVTLKIRSRSPKPNHLFNLCQRYIHANLVRIWLMVREISCRQASVTLTLTQTGSAPKTICPPPPHPPFSWGT